jgi:hypothetical protein
MVNLLVNTDVIGIAILIYFSVSEGKEAFEKTSGEKFSCGMHCNEITK